MSDRINGAVKIAEEAERAREQVALMGGRHEVRECMIHLLPAILNPDLPWDARERLMILAREICAVRDQFDAEICRRAQDDG